MLGKLLFYVSRQCCVKRWHNNFCLCCERSLFYLFSVMKGTEEASQAKNGGSPLVQLLPVSLPDPSPPLALSLRLRHAYRTLLTYVYANLTLGTLLSIYYCMLLSSMWSSAWVILNQTYTLHRTFPLHTYSFLSLSFPYSRHTSPNPLLLAFFFITLLYLFVLLLRHI